MDKEMPQIYRKTAAACLAAFCYAVQLYHNLSQVSVGKGDVFVKDSNYKVVPYRVIKAWGE
jgi:hypothetical protein